MNYCIRNGSCSAANRHQVRATAAASSARRKGHNAWSGSILTKISKDGATTILSGHPHWLLECTYLRCFSSLGSRLKKLRTKPGPDGRQLQLHFWIPRIQTKSRTIKLVGSEGFGEIIAKLFIGGVFWTRVAHVEHASLREARLSLGVRARCLEFDRVAVGDSCHNSSIDLLSPLFWGVNSTNSLDMSWCVGSNSSYNPSLNGV